jgi:hypothetical protein
VSIKYHVDVFVLVLTITVRRMEKPGFGKKYVSGVDTGRICSGPFIVTKENCLVFRYLSKPASHYCPKCVNVVMAYRYRE